MQQRALIGVLLLAIAARIAFLLLFGNTLDFTLEGNAIHGSEAYDEYAQNLLQSGVYGRELGEADAAIPPLYSYVLATVYGIFGRGYIQVGLFHTLLDCVSILLLYQICKRLFAQGGVLSLRAAEWLGVLAGLFYALYPYLIFQNLTLIDTPFWILLLHAYVLLMILIRERERFDKTLWGWAILAGLVLGLSLLARPLMPPFALLAAVWFLFRRSLWQTLLRLAPVAIVGFLVVLPWIVRNYGLYNDFVPMTTTSGANFWQGNSVWTIPVFQAGYDVQWTAPDEEEGIGDMPVNEADARRFELAWDYLRSHPEDLALLYWTKFTVHWNIAITPLYNPQNNQRMDLAENGELLILSAERNIEGVTEANTAYDSGLLNTVGRPVHMLYFGTLLLLAIIGIVLSLKDWREVSLLWFVQIAMMLVYMFFHPSTRYRAPSDPLLFAFSAYTLVYLWNFWRNRHAA
jgi:4-amino-4-deoxy-L-arabinose transferase-like glycosyltransferase